MVPVAHPRTTALGRAQDGTGLCQSLGAIAAVGQGTGQRRCLGAVVMLGHPPRLEQPEGPGPPQERGAAGGSCLGMEIREPGEGT